MPRFADEKLQEFYEDWKISKEIAMRDAAESKELARLALDGLNSHERVCTERYVRLDETNKLVHEIMTGLQDSMRLNSQRQWQTLATALTMAIGGFGTLGYFVITHLVK